MPQRKRPASCDFTFGPHSQQSPSQEELLLHVSRAAPRTQVATQAAQQKLLPWQRVHALVTPAPYLVSPCALAFHVQGWPFASLDVLVAPEAYRGSGARCSAAWSAIFCCLTKPSHLQQTQALVLKSLHLYIESGPHAPSVPA